MTDPRIYEANFKQWDHTGSIVPQVEHSESQYPSAELKPAPWLPVGSYDKKFEVYRVIAAGKPVALDGVGFAVPAGLKLAFETAGGSTILTYVAADATEGTTDLVTGETVTGATSYTQTEVTTALRARGLIRATEFARDFISNPIGYAPYSYLQWCGGDGFNPALYRQHNHNLQHGVACGTDKVLTIPIVPAQEATETMGDGAISSSAITFGTSQWHDSAGIYATTRYASDVAIGDNVVAYVFGKTPVAKITQNTAITDSGGILATWTEVDSIASVIALGTGYFYIDYDAGVMFIYAALGGVSVPSSFTDGTTTITYYTYEDAATGNANYAMALGDLRPGDLVTFDSTSSYVKWTPDLGTASGGASGAAYSADPDFSAAADSAIAGQIEALVKDSSSRVVGQVLAIWTWPRSGLDRVMTQFRQLTAVEQMPGTATAGMTDAIVLSGAANKVAIINFIKR